MRAGGGCQHCHRTGCMGVGWGVGRTGTQGLGCSRPPGPCLSPPTPPGSLPPGGILGSEVTHCHSLGSRHAAFPRAASRGQHPPRKGLPARRGPPLGLSSIPRQFCLCCCVTVLGARPFVSFLVLTRTRLSPVRLTSHPRLGR